MGGAGPFACVVVYGKATSVMLFQKSSDAEAHKRRLDSIQSDKKRWKINRDCQPQTECEQSERKRPHGVSADALALSSRRECVK